MTLLDIFHGKRIRLAALDFDDLPTLCRWYDDGSFQRHLDSVAAYPMTLSEARRWLEEQHQDKYVFNFSIRLRESDEIIGWMELNGISWNNRFAWLAIAIGPPFQSKGYGAEAMRLLLDFSFLELNLHRVQLNVFDYNTGAIRLYEKMGFVREGTYRQTILRDGEYHDMILFGILEEEWKERRKNG